MDEELLPLGTILQLVDRDDPRAINDYDEITSDFRESDFYILEYIQDYLSTENPGYKYARLDNKPTRNHYPYWSSPCSTIHDWIKKGIIRIVQPDSIKKEKIYRINLLDI